MSLLTVKLRRDFRASWPRFVLMVIAMAVSLTVFGGVLLARGAATRETRDAYLGTAPASATLVLAEPIPVSEMADVVAAARRQPGVISTTGRTQFDTDVQVNGQPRLLPLQVFAAAPDDPMRLATFEIEQATWPPAPDEIFLTGDSLEPLDVSIGDTITVESPGGTPMSLSVAGTVYDPSLAPSPQEQKGHAYVSTAALGSAERPAALDQLKVHIAERGQAEPSDDRDAIVAAASDLGQWLQRERGIEVREIQVPEPYEHPHQFQSDTLLLALLVGGVAALVLSAILVANMLNNLFTQQIPQIGIMKAVGARSSRVAAQYLAMSLLVSAVATLLALGASIAIGRVGVEWLIELIGIEPASTAAPPSNYLVIAGVGLGLPTLLALVPLVRASRTTVRAALDHRGGGSSSSAASRLFARVSRVRRLNRGLLMALRNMARRPTRFALSVCLLASAGAVFVAGMSLSDGVEAVSTEAAAQRNWDVDVQLTTPVAIDEVVPIVERVPGVSQVDGFNSASTGIGDTDEIPVSRTYPDQGHGRATVNAVPSDATLFSPPPVLEGRWLEPGETGAVVLNQIARENSVADVRPGDTVDLTVGGVPTTWRVVGIVEELSGSNATYVTAEGFAEAMGGRSQVNQLRVATDDDDEASRASVASATADRLAAEGIDVKSAVSVSRKDAISGGHMGPIVSIVLSIAVAMGIVGGIGLATTMSANVLDRTREFGVMRAIGARPKAVRRIVVAEGVFLALTSCIVAILPALVLTSILGDGLGDLFFSAPLPYRVSALGVGIWTALVLLGAIIATDAAASRASRITVRDALAYL